LFEQEQNIILLSPVQKFNFLNFFLTKINTTIWQNYLFRGGLLAILYLVKQKDNIFNIYYIIVISLTLNTARNQTIAFNVI